MQIANNQDSKLTSAMRWHNDDLVSSDLYQHLIFNVNFSAAKRTLMVLCLNIYGFYISGASKNASAGKMQAPDLGLNIRYG